MDASIKAADFSASEESEESFGVTNSRQAVHRFVGWSTPWPDSFGVLQRACLLGSFCPLQFEISSPTRCNVLQCNQNNHSRDWLETSSRYDNYKLVNCFPNKDSRLPSTLEPVLHQQLISMFLFHLTLFQRLALAFNTHQLCDLCDLCILSDMVWRLPRHHSFLFLCFSWVSGLLCFWCYFSKSFKNSCCSYTSSPSISNNIIDLYLCFRGNLSLKALVLPRCKPPKEFSEKSWDALTFFFELGIQVIQPQSIKNWTMNDMTRWYEMVEQVEGFLAKDTTGRWSYQTESCRHSPG